MNKMVNMEQVNRVPNATLPPELAETKNQRVWLDRLADEFDIADVQAWLLFIARNGKQKSNRTWRRVNS